MNLSSYSRRGSVSQNVISVLLFGSVIRGEEEPLSDIDLLILTKDKDKAEVAIAKLQGKISNRFGNAVSPYILTESELAEKDNSQLIEEIHRKNMLVCGKPWSE